MTGAVKHYRRTWTVEQTDAMFAAIAIAPTFAVAAGRLGVTLKTITARMHALRQAGDPRALDRKKTSTLELPRPADFAERASHTINRDLIAHYGVSKATIIKWRKETGTTRQQGGVQVGGTRPTPPPVPDNFARLAPTMRRYEASLFWDVGGATIDRWSLKSGVACKRVQSHARRGHSPALAADHNAARVMSRAGQAADFLRRLGPVYRCDEQGNPEGKPTHWRRGSYVLTDAEIIDRAERNGWQPDAWRALATTITTEGARAA